MLNPARLRPYNLTETKDSGANFAWVKYACSARYVNHIVGCFLSVSLVFAGSPSIVFAFDTLPDLGEIYDTEIKFGDIRDAFARGNYKLAMKLTYDMVYQKARQELLDINNTPIIIDKLSKAIQNIIDDPDKTDEEKGEAITEVIARTLEPYEYSDSDGQLNAAIKYSIEYGATYIQWDSRIRSDRCYGAFIDMVYDQIDDRWYQVIKYVNYYHVQVPDYYIYRIVDGKQTLITQIKGYKHISENTISLSLDSGWNDILKQGYDYFRNIPEAAIEDGRVFWWDLHADVRAPGETLSYKIVADNSNYKTKDCGYSNQWISTITADQDGDGRMDYIDEEEYLKYFGQYYAWLVPVISQY